MYIPSTYYAKHFAYINSCNPYISPEKYILLETHFIVKDTEFYS